VSRSRPLSFNIALPLTFLFVSPSLVVLILALLAAFSCLVVLYVWPRVTPAAPN
jgi:hypothetical protein